MKALPLLCAFSLLASTALAAPEPDNGASGLEQAKAVYDQANARLEADDVPTALDLFRRSRTILPSVYNVQGEAYCLYRLGRYDEALEQYEELERMYRAELSPDAAHALDQRLQELRQRIGSIAVVGPKGGVVFIDGRKRGMLPDDAPLRVVPGDHTVRVTVPGRAAFEKNVNVKAGATLVVQVEIEPAPKLERPTPASKAPERKRGVPAERPLSVQRTLGWAALGVGVVGVGVGGYFGLRAISKKHESDDAIEGEDCFTACHDAWEEGQSAARVSNIAFGIGAVGLIGGTLLLVTADDEVRPGVAGPFSLGWTRKW